MKTMLQRLFAMLALLALAACGGGGGAKGDPPFGGGGGVTPPPSAKASDISLTLSSPSLSNSGTETVTATVVAVDANRNTVSGIPVILSVDNGATIAVDGTTTNTAGVVSGKVAVGSNRSNRVITITALSGDLTRQVSLRVVGARITGTALPAVLAPSQAGVVQYRVVDATGNALAGTEIAITGSGGTQTTGTTSSNGDFEYKYTAPAAAGNLDIRAAAAGAEVTTTVLVQSGPGSIPVVPPGSVRSSSVSANPRVVVVNATTATSNRAEVRALFVGNANAPVPNIRVRFDLDGDRNSIGGTFSTGSTVIYSDANGTASSAYIPGSRFSPTDGVTIRACWDYQDFAVGTCPNAATTTLTVISDALSVTIGTDNLITISDLTYVRRFVVQVNDSSGLAKADVVVSPLLDLPAYFKGFWTRAPDRWVKTELAACENEDLNRNGVLEVYSNGGQEDADADAQLEPRKADAVVAFEGSNRTDSLGQVKLRVTYPQNVASWVAYNLLVAASGVAGTEGRSNYQGVLEAPDPVVKAEPSPPFRESPYGIQGSPTIVVVTPDNSARGALCTNPR